MGAHLYRPVWRGEDLGLSMGQGTLTALKTREGGRGGEGEVGRGREKVGGEEVKIFNK